MGWIVRVRREAARVTSVGSEGEPGSGVEGSGEKRGA